MTLKSISGRSLFTLFLLITGLFTSCTGDKDVLDATGSSWRVTKIKEKGAITWKKVDPEIRLTFVSESLYTLKLDTNHCEGEYRIFSGGKVYFSLSACTEMCCDSDIALKIHDMLPEMTEYREEKNVLHLEGKGEMELENDDR
jgi:heat shock protein HslJ